MKTTQLMVLAAITFASAAFAVDPPPDGGYPNQNTAEGENALFNLNVDMEEGGYDNTAVGFQALYNNTSGAANTASGVFALYSNTTGASNTAAGDRALAFNTTGIGNTANGILALYSNTTGNANTASGENALQNSTTASFNTANGSGALASNTTGNSNTANGHYALYSNTTANQNTADGVSALELNTTGINNTAIGFEALNSNTIGNYNAANGQGALSANTTGSNNTAAGQNALLKNTTGKSNIAIGSNAGLNLTTGSSNIDIGNRGVAGESKTIRVGIQGTQTATFMAGISGATVPAGVAVIIDTNGHLGTVVSSARYKEAIQPMNASSEAILSLQPVKFRYKKELDAQGIPQFGLVAEDVAKVNPDLVARDEEGKPYTVRYEAVNAMLLNEFLKEHRKVEEQAATIEQQEHRLTELERAVAELR